MKTYVGSPAAARNYVEADRARADDYYLAEGVGVAERFTVDAEGRVVALPPLAGDAYEAWVAGVDPDTRVPRGRLRTDARAVRFVEVTVNGPKSWSLAAELHPEVAAAYDAAQDRAAVQVIGWLAQHATTRVGPRGGQVQVPVERLEAVTVRHRTSRAGDPHRHLHLQVNARVEAAGAWRGLHTVGVRDSLAAINGIGTAAMTADPDFRAALAHHGFTLEASGDIRELAPFVGAFSKRAAQIARHLDRYEAEWRRANPTGEPGPGLRQVWDRRAWAEQRPDKVTAVAGADLTVRWLGELADLGYRHRDRPAELVAPRVGELDRDAIADSVVRTVAATRSGWNAADLRGESEQHLARLGVIADAQVRSELAEDLTARALARCFPLLGRTGVPEHIRGLTSPRVLAVEAEIVSRLAARSQPSAGAATADAANRVAGVEGADVAGEHVLDAAQTRVVAALAGAGELVVVEGAAGAGKTSTLAATRAALESEGRRLVVVTPTLKAAKVAAAEVGADAGSVAWLIHQHGWRWDQSGAWTRLAVGDTDPTGGRVFGGPSGRTRLRPGDLLLVDEAGMLDQNSARALLIVADECRARLALVGDRHQLTAVGRGGVLDLALRWVDPTAHLDLDTVHRFTRPGTGRDGRTILVADTEYAELSLAMRSGTDPGAVFDALVQRGQVHVHDSEHDRLTALADTYVTSADPATAADGASGAPAIIADTREQVAELNAVIRNRLVVAGRVEDARTVTTRAGERIGVGDRVATRRNDADLDVANRDTWTVTNIGRGGGDQAHGDAAAQLIVTSPERGIRTLPASYVREHVELAYASTVYGVQGDTVGHAHLLLGEHTSAASAYVAMTRGRHANSLHLVATDLEDAREQWVATFERDRADLGPAHAAELAATQAANYATTRPLEEAIADLRDAWTREQDVRDQLDRHEPLLAQLRGYLAVRDTPDPAIAAAEITYRQAGDTLQRATARLEQAETAVAAETAGVREQLLDRWDADREPARAAARIVQAGPGRLGLRLAAVNRAQEQLSRWSVTWQPYLPAMPTSSAAITRYAAGYTHRPHVADAFDAHARAAVQYAHPELGALHDAVTTAARSREDAAAALAAATRDRAARLASFGSLNRAVDPAGALALLEPHVTSLRTELDQRHHAVARGRHDPAILALTPQRLELERARWQHDRHEKQDQRDQAALTRAAIADAHRRYPRPATSTSTYTSAPTPGINR